MTNSKILGATPVETVYILNLDSKRDTPKFYRRCLASSFDFPELISHIKRNPFKYSTFDLFYFLYHLRPIHLGNQIWVPNTISSSLVEAMVLSETGDDYSFIYHLINSSFSNKYAQMHWLRGWLKGNSNVKFANLVDLVRTFAFHHRSEKDFTLLGTITRKHRLPSGQNIRVDESGVRCDRVISPHLILPEKKSHKSPITHTRRAHQRTVRCGRGRSKIKVIEIGETVVNG